MRKNGRAIVFALLLLLVPVLANAWTLTTRVYGPSSAGEVEIRANNATGAVLKTINAGVEYVQVPNGTAAYVTVTANGYNAAEVLVDYVKQAEAASYLVDGDSGNHQLTVNFGIAADAKGNVSVDKKPNGTVLLQYNGTSSMTGFTNLTFGTAIGVKASPRADYKVSSITVSKLAAGSTVPAVTYPPFTAAGAGQAVTVGVTVDQAVVEVSAAYELVASAKAMFSAPLKAVAGKPVTLSAAGTTANTDVTYEFVVPGQAGQSGPSQTYTFTPSAAEELTVTLNVKPQAGGAALATKTAKINVVSESAAYNNLCTGCHTGSTPAIIEAYNAGTHGNTGIACTVCHTGGTAGHGAMSDDLQLSTTAAPVVADANGFVGAAVCANCHNSTHDTWSKSFHTLKATYGPAFDGQSAGNSNIHPWVQENWTSLLSHAILDQVSSAMVNDEANAGKGLTTKDIVLTKAKYAMSDVAIVVGQVRKQRYAVYYGGEAVTEAYVAYTTNGGIRYDIRKDGAGNPIEVSYPGNKQRAGYKFLFIEMDLTKTTPAPKANNYGTWRSWQEQCIGCHTTGFDPDAWTAAKAEFVAGERADLKDIFVSDIRITCEACHGPGKDHATNGDKTKIINPAKLAASDPTRQLVCGQCHTRADKNTRYGAGSNDKRGFVLGVDTFTDVMEYTRPAWGDGNRQVSIDGKGRRDHQMDMDMLLTKYIHEEVQGKPSSYHGNQACFDCHTSHDIGSNVDLQPSGSGGRGHLKVSSDVDGTIRLKDTRDNLCGSCHTGEGTELPGSIDVATALSRLNGSTGWSAYGWAWNGTATWNNEGGRGSANQHIFNTIVDQSDGLAKVYGLAPEQYIWSTSNTASTTKGDFKAIWPWERTLEVAAGKTIVYGATPWVQQ